jgi:hypothetical protein
VTMRRSRKYVSQASKPDWYSTKKGKMWGSLISSKRKQITNHVSWFIVHPKIKQMSTLWLWYCKMWSWSLTSWTLLNSQAQHGTVNKQLPCLSH